MPLLFANFRICLIFVCSFFALILNNAVQARTATAEGLTKQLAIYQAHRSLPAKATVTDVNCREVNVSFSIRWRCTVEWQK